MVRSLLLFCSFTWASNSVHTPLPTDREWQVLVQPAPGQERAVLADAAQRLGDWKVVLAGAEIDGARLKRWSGTPSEEPLLRAVREDLRQPVDLDDLLRFLDDVLLAGEQGRTHERFVVPSGRARAAGILVHPDDVFKSRPRRYGSRGELAVDEPKAPSVFPPAPDGAPLGPEWTARYPNPTDRDVMLRALHEARPGSTFPSRLAALLVQLELQGADVWLTSTVRSRHRGYLMWGAFLLSRSGGAEDALKASLAKLEAANVDWGLHTPIQWEHPAGWRATVEAARTMADTYDVVYATESGARWSNHYGGEAADLVAVGLPRQLELLAPDGAVQRFDLSGPTETRDLSLTPELIDWIEEHFRFRKLASDYPHWSDAD